MAHKYIKELTSSQKAALKGKAHALNPIVQVGAHGVTESLRKEIEAALHHHELIKVQLPGQNSADEKVESMTELASKLPLHSHVVARIGRTLILYFEQDPEEAKLPLSLLKKDKKK